MADKITSARVAAKGGPSGPNPGDGAQASPGSSTAQKTGKKPEQGKDTDGSDRAIDSSGPGNPADKMHASPTQKAHPRSPSQDLRVPQKPKQPIQKKGSWASQAGRIFSKKRPASSDIAIDLDQAPADDKADRIARAVPLRTIKLTSVFTSQRATMKDPHTPEHQISLAQIHPTMLAEWISDEHYFNDFVKRLSQNTRVYTHLRQIDQNKDGVAGINTSAIRLSRREANQHTVDLYNERAESIRVSKRECTQLLPATVLALRCLSEENTAIPISFELIAAGLNERRQGSRGKRSPSSRNNVAERVPTLRQSCLANPTFHD